MNICHLPASLKSAWHGNYLLVPYSLRKTTGTMLVSSKLSLRYDSVLCLRHISLNFSSADPVTPSSLIPLFCLFDDIGLQVDEFTGASRTLLAWTENQSDRTLLAKTEINGVGRTFIIGVDRTLLARTELQ